MKCQIEILGFSCGIRKKYIKPQRPKIFDTLTRQSFINTRANKQNKQTKQNSSNYGGLPSSRFIHGNSPEYSQCLHLICRPTLIINQLVMFTNTQLLHWYPQEFAVWIHITYNPPPWQVTGYSQPTLFQAVFKIWFCSR